MRSKGFQALVAYKKGATWGTAVAAGALDGLWVKAPNYPDGGTELIENMQLTGAVTQKPPTLGDRRATGNPIADLVYEGLDVLIAQVMGTAGAPTTVDTTARQHVWKIKDDLDGIFGTYAYEALKDAKVFEAPSFKLTGFTIRAKANQNVEIEFRGIASDFTDASAVNTTTTIDTVTVPTNAQYLATFAHLAFQMNAQTGGALSGSDAVYISEFELSVDRKLEGAVTTRFGNKIDEPHQAPSSFAEVNLKVTFAHYQDGTGGNATLVADQMAGTEKKAKLILTSSVLAGAATQPFQFVFWLPRIVAQPADKPKVTGPGITSWSQSFRCYHVSTIPTGFSAGYTTALIVEAFNQRTTDALA